MHNIDPTDPGREINWGKASSDYARYRPGYPGSFFQRIVALGIGLPGQRILDLGTGTGVLAREFARRGGQVTGVDISKPQLEAAEELAKQEGVQVEFHHLPAEDTGFQDGEFDVVTASQAWLYFDKARVIPEVKRS